MSERIRGGPSPQTLSDARTDPPVRPLGADAAETLEARIRRFTEESRTFSRDFIAVAGPVFTHDSVRSATVNVQVAKSLFGKWTIEILLMIYGYREQGFQELRRNLKGVSPRVLSQKLRLLEERGLVERTVLPTRPTRVRYTLTEDGLLLAKLGEPVFLFLRYRQNRSSPPRRRSRTVNWVPPASPLAEATGA